MPRDHGRLGKCMTAPVIGSVSAVVTLDPVLVFVEVADVTVPPRSGARDEEGVT